MAKEISKQNFPFFAAQTKLKMRKIFFAILVLATVFTACDSIKPGGGKITEGKVSYKIDLSATEMSFIQKQLFEAAKLTISFKDAFMKTDFDLGMVAISVTADGNTKTGLMLSSMMGNKTAIKMSAEDFSKKEKEKGKYTVEYSDETKEIAGYNCKKANLKLENGSTLAIYYSEDIQPAQINTDFTYEGIKGFPLEMQIDMNGMKINMVASSVDGTPLPADYFSMEIPEGYTESDMNQFSGAMGGK